jgi:hypothetical protein
MSSTTIDRVAVAEGKAMEGTTLTLPVPTKDRRSEGAVVRVVDLHG